MKTMILGAGASRAVAYASVMSTLSPLDSDFFELLQRLTLSDANNKIRQKVNRSRDFVIEAVLSQGNQSLWTSMERMFYTLHVHKRMRDVIFPGEPDVYTEEGLLKHFARAIQALLRAAHEKMSCRHHEYLFRRLAARDAIVTFNYDLVAEGALKELFGGLRSQYPFGPWIYRFARSPRHNQNVPTIFKLHGSVNWTPVARKRRQGVAFEVIQKSWADFDRQPGYLAKGPDFPILLPYWDKKIEDAPWRDIWQKAAAHLRRTTTLIIWGYSLPLTDLKARELLRITLLSGQSALRHVCVIDPSKEVRERWRSTFLRQQFWQYESIEDFFQALERRLAPVTSFAPLIPD
jgi:hypothetical protein